VDDLVALSKLIVAAGGAALPAEINALWATMAAQVPVLGTMTFANIPETGLIVDHANWVGLNYVEGETLHYKPPMKIAAAIA
jgi:NADH-quinone oxidoreductase subunit G